MFEKSGRPYVSDDDVSTADEDVSVRTRPAGRPLSFSSAINVVASDEKWIEIMLDMIEICNKTVNSGII